MLCRSGGLSAGLASSPQEWSCSRQRCKWKRWGCGVKQCHAVPTRPLEERQVREMLRKSWLSATKMVYATVIPSFVWITPAHTEKQKCFLEGWRAFSHFPLVFLLLLFCSCFCRLLFVCLLNLLGLYMYFLLSKTQQTHQAVFSNAAVWWCRNPRLMGMQQDGSRGAVLLSWAPALFYSPSALFSALQCGIEAKHFLS